MSGITPPSILTMQYAVDTGFRKYVNLAFPYRVQIESIWFTADDGLSGYGYGGSEGNIFGYDVFDLNRVLRLGAIKQRNAKRASSTGDAPTDLNIAWEDWDAGMDANNKPSIWFGLPDDRSEVADDNPDTPEEVVQLNQYHDTLSTYRSTVRPLPPLNQMGYWFNYGWDEGEYLANRYKTDLSIMNPDEVLSLFCYSDGGDWSGYDDNSGLVTIFVQYTGIGGEATSNPTRIWD